MPDKTFQHIELKLPEPKFGSKLTSLVLELEKLRSLQLKGTTLKAFFFELKQLFHFLESIGSARIEGNRTTIAQFIETQLEDRAFVNEDIEEIRNIEKAMRWVDEQAPEYPINRAFVSELHKTVVNNLTSPPDGEGDHTPGKYRGHQVEINASFHLPPPHFLINELMEELFAFINNDLPSQYDLLKIAIAHHRFMWIHPFENGNGRTGRLFTYAMLVKTGFRVHVGQILNPTAADLAVSISEIRIGMQDAPPGAKALQDIVGGNSDYPGYLKQRAGVILEKIKHGEKLSSDYPYPVQVWTIGEQPVFALGGELLVACA